jgi:Rv0078B-related antitoxin
MSGPTASRSEAFLALSEAERLEHDAIRDRLLQTFELFEFGVEMMAATLRRKHPDATPERIEELLDHWLAKRSENQSTLE